MFATPHGGWTEWEINGHKIGSISYLSDVPYEFINICCDYINNPVGFNLIFDGEERDTALSLIGHYFCSYSFMGNDPPYTTEVTPVSDFILWDSSDGPRFVEGLLKEAVEDFERDFDLWVTWNPGLYEDEEEIEKERTALRELIDKAKKIIVRKPYIKYDIVNPDAPGRYPVNFAQKAFFSIFGDVFDLYGCLMDERYAAGKTDRGGYENHLFAIGPCCGEEPNFVYKPENIIIHWNKIPMCDAWCNTRLTIGELEDIFSSCRESMMSTTHG